MIDKEGKSKERYLFLFKARILICKVRRISEDRSVFILKDIIRVRKDREYDIAIFAIKPHKIINRNKLDRFVSVTGSRSEGPSRRYTIF